MSIPVYNEPAVKELLRDARRLIEERGLMQNELVGMNQEDQICFCVSGAVVAAAEQVEEDMDLNAKDLDLNELHKRVNGYFINASLYEYAGTVRNALLKLCYAIPEKERWPTPYQTDYYPLGHEPEACVMRHNDHFPFTIRNELALEWIDKALEDIT